MADRRQLLQRLLRPYAGEPPPGLYRSQRPDLLIRIAGMAVPHFVSVVTRLGGSADLPDLPAAVNRRQVRVAAARQVARDQDVVELTLTAPDGAPLVRWHPGAHIDLHLPSGRTRQYSLCGDPERSGEYRIAVRLIGRDGGSGEAHALAVGDVVEISEPRNAFMMPIPGTSSRAETLRFIAGGIGITPILPMVRLAQRRGVPWSLCYTGRSRDSLPFLDELSGYGDRVRVRTDDEFGLPTAADLLGEVDVRTAVYVCGPPAMTDLVRAAIPVDAGVEVHVERFSPLPVVDGAPFEMQLGDGEVVPVASDRTALAALRDVRPNVGYSCQQGFCGSCVQRVLDGDVDHRDSLLTEQQRRDGQMLVCVSRAKTVGARLVLDV
ncbi:PDR/VanB family oxidoreductase [Mycolicibacterium murale]|jgi:ferredoxin-NADP reductase|nr:PDR/VanB family oxidoreductase [Mycolicibacterium murale]